jgi:hypothetical protein
MFTDQEFCILTLKEMTEIKKRSWMNWLLIFILLINGRCNARFLHHKIFTKVGVQ